MEVQQRYGGFVLNVVMNGKHQLIIEPAKRIQGAPGCAGRDPAGMGDQRQGYVQTEPAAEAEAAKGAQ